MGQLNLIDTPWNLVEVLADQPFKIARKTKTKWFTWKYAAHRQLGFLINTCYSSKQNRDSNLYFSTIMVVLLPHCIAGLWRYSGSRMVLSTVFYNATMFFMNSFLTHSLIQMTIDSIIVQLCEQISRWPKLTWALMQCAKNSHYLRHLASIRVHLIPPVQILSLIKFLSEY